jgi:hypothetical protein
MPAALSDNPRDSTQGKCSVRLPLAGTRL